MALVAWLDAWSGVAIQLGIFYFAPVAISTWYGSRLQGLLVALSSVGLWLATDTLWSPDQASFYAHSWNTLARLMPLLLFSGLLGVVRAQMELLRLQAERDGLTGLHNRRSFARAVALERERLLRFHHPFSLLYIDLDNFKHVNDTQGHAQGDRLLRTVAHGLRTHTRGMDVPARLGGDEFAVLLVEADADAATAAVQHLERELRGGMRQQRWPVTFSIGLVTFRSVPPSAEEALHLADQLMYQVKRGAKDAVLCQIWESGRLTPPRRVGRLDAA